MKIIGVFCYRVYYVFGLGVGEVRVEGVVGLVVVLCRLDDLVDKWYCVWVIIVFGVLY